LLTLLRLCCLFSGGRFFVVFTLHNPLGNDYCLDLPLTIYPGVKHLERQPSVHIFTTPPPCTIPPFGSRPCLWLHPPLFPPPQFLPLFHLDDSTIAVTMVLGGCNPSGGRWGKLFTTFPPPPPFVEPTAKNSLNSIPPQIDGDPPPTRKKIFLDSPHFLFFPARPFEYPFTPPCALPRHFFHVLVLPFFFFFPPLRPKAKTVLFRGLFPLPSPPFLFQCG